MTDIEYLERRVERLDIELAAVRTELRALRQPAAPPPGPVSAPPPPAFVQPPPAPTFVQTPPAPTFVQPRPAPTFVQTPPAPAPRGSFTPPRGVREPSGGWEDLMAGRVMAWVGGAAVLIGLILFLALAVSRGWIGEEARTLMAGLASLLLVAGGARAYERGGRTEAAVAATAAGVAGGFATLAVATEVYALIPAAPGLVAALALGATAACLALRWRSPTIAVLGIAGALLSPVLVGANVEEPVTMGLCVAAYAGAIAVCVALGWSWLGLLAFLIVTPQWVVHALDNDTLDVVAAFGTLGALAAGGFVLRERDQDFDLTSHLLLALNAAVMAAAGWGVLSSSDGIDPALWIAALALAHLAGGLALLRVRPGTRTFAIAAVGIGVILGDIAFAELASGLALPLVWALSAVLFALLVRVEAAAVLGLGAHLALAIGHVLAQEAPLGDLGGNGSAAGLAGALGIAAACLVSGRLTDARLRRALDVTGLLAVAYATALAFDGAALAAMWAAEAAALGALARQGERDAREAAYLFLIGATTVALTLVAPLKSLALGLDDAGAAIVALLAVAAAAASLMPAREGRFAAAVTMLYLASALVVTWIEGQPGQLSLSALWAVTGLAALLAGVVRDEAQLRACALGLLAVATGKVFVVDLASLDSMTRVGSFLVLGTLLLGGAFAWQRARPRPDGS